MLKNLEDVIGISIVSSSNRDKGWTFTDEEGCTPDHLYGSSHMHQLYTKADPHYTGRVTVPVLWDKEKETIVNNESSEIIRMFNSAFVDVVPDTVDYYPEELRAAIDEINAFTYDNVNNGVYRTGFATTQEAYEEGYHRVFAALDELEARLAKQRYLVGDRLTEADWRLFPTLLRFDIVYYSLFKCNRQHVYEFPNLWNYTLELYQYPGVAERSRLDHFKRGYYSGRKTNPTGIVPLGPDIDFTQPHDRDRLPKAA